MSVFTRLWRAMRSLEPCGCPKGRCACDSGLLTGQTDPGMRRDLKALARDLHTQYGNERKEAGDG